MRAARQPVAQVTGLPPWESCTASLAHEVKTNRLPAAITKRQYLYARLAADTKNQISKRPARLHEIVKTTRSLTS